MENTPPQTYTLSKNQVLIGLTHKGNWFGGFCPRGFVMGFFQGFFRGVCSGSFVLEFFCPDTKESSFNSQTSQCVRSAGAGWQKSCDVIPGHFGCHLQHSYSVTCCSIVDIYLARVGRADISKV